MDEISPSFSRRRHSSECLAGPFGTCPHPPGICARFRFRSVHPSIEMGRSGRTAKSQIALREWPGQGSSPSVKLRRATGKYPFLTSVLDKVMRPGLTSNRVTPSCLWTLVLQPHEYQARHVARAGRERTVFARGTPILGSCARHTVHSGDRASLLTEFRYPFENKLPPDRVFRKDRPDRTVRRIGNRSHPIGNLEGAISGFAGVVEDMTARRLGAQFPQGGLSTADRWAAGRCPVLLDPNGRVATSRASSDADHRISCGGRERSRRVV